jgi:hypothetical protein
LISETEDADDSVIYETGATISRATLTHASENIGSTTVHFLAVELNRGADTSFWGAALVPVPFPRRQPLIG